MMMKNGLVITLIEDAGLITDQADSYTGNAALVDQLQTQRWNRMGVIVVRQDLASASPKILSNTENLIFVGHQGLEDRQIQNILGITPEQATKIRVMGPGEFVSLIPTVYPKAVYGTFDPFIDYPVSSEDCHKSAEAFLQTVSAVKASQQDDSPVTQHAAITPASFSPSTELEKLRLTAGHPENLLRPLTDQYSLWGLSRSQGTKVIDRLEQQNLIRRHRVATGRRGGWVIYLEITEEGWKQIEATGSRRIQLERYSFGSYLHRLAGLALNILGQQANQRVDFEVHLGPCRFDVRWRNNAGETIFFQIALSRVDREIEALKQAFTVPLVRESRVVVVTADPRFTASFQAALKRIDPDQVIPDRVCFYFLGQILEAGRNRHSLFKEETS